MAVDMFDLQLSMCIFLIYILYINVYVMAVMTIRNCRISFSDSARTTQALDARVQPSV